ncbi:MAG: ABC transporter ATP-binding protein [Phycisphaerales bacterium]|nr:ABC transporter ATP-binding protein [Phycisphaerales bacterium]
MSRYGHNELVVEAVGLTKVFRDFWMRTKAKAVDRVDFEIRPGEIFGLLGPNGSGKSTTIKMILGLLHKTSGRLVVFGKNPNDVAIKRRIGFLPEESYLYRFLNARETLDYYGRLFQLDRSTRKRRTEELLEMVGLSNVAHRPIGEFSKGMTRRIGIAQALVNDPDFLILDEPTSGLDPIGTKQVKDLLLQLKARNKTILLSSHLLSDVQDVCDRMVMLYGGTIQAQGTVQDLLQDTDHTVIEAPRLKAETIAKVEEVIQSMEGVAIDRVRQPRQRLEDVFMKMVAEAKEKKLATSGAAEGGETAAFLREAPDSTAVIDSLVSAGEVPAMEVDKVEAVASDDRVRDDVLEKLTGLDDAGPSQVSQGEIPEAPSNVDSDLIEGLLSSEPKDDEEPERS